MRNATRILLTATGLLAAGNSARAQTLTAPAGQAYTIISNVPASAVTEVTYQWYRNNNPIPGATKESYTVPATVAYGDNVAFYRLATAQECTGIAEKKSNTVTVTFTGYIMPEGCTLVVGGICWAKAHVNEPNTFAAQPDMYVNFYQWNRLTAYSAEDPITPAWNSTSDYSATWTVNPCPSGWRLPSQTEYLQLTNSGTTWANANTRGNAIAGRFYGYNHASCSLPSNMNGCVFMPASGFRNLSDGVLTLWGQGVTWSSTQYDTSIGYCFNFTNSTSSATGGADKRYAYAIRCVQ